jgi:hypothetical protein
VRPATSGSPEPSSVRSTRSCSSANGVSPILLLSTLPPSQVEDWGHEPIEKLVGTKLEWSTIEEADGNRKLRTTKACWLCGHRYSGGPDAIRTHLDGDIKPRDVLACKPKPLARTRHKLIVQELWRRAEVANKKQKAAATNAELKETGRAAAANLTADQARAAEMFKLKTPGEVTNAWLEVGIEKALPLNFFDTPSVRNAMAITAKCGSRLVVAGEVEVPKRKKITEKILPKFDSDLDIKVRDHMRGVMPITGATLISDGWSSCANRPIINALAASPTGIYFIKAVDTSGKTKDAKFIADFMIDVIDVFGPANVTAVCMCMDGACEAVEDEHTHVFCFICPTHSLVNFMKNVCAGHKQKIHVRGHDGPTLEWGEELFADTFTQHPGDPSKAALTALAPCRPINILLVSRVVHRCGRWSSGSQTTTSRSPSTAKSPARRSPMAPPS